MDGVINAAVLELLWQRGDSDQHMAVTIPDTVLYRNR
jgi:hypothetical protein